MGPEWVDEVLLAGEDDETCLSLGEPIDRATLRGLVAARQAELTTAGLRPGGTVALYLPPSLAFITHLLATWRTGAQATLLDYRLTAYEVEQAAQRLGSQFLVSPRTPVTGGLRGFFDVDVAVTVRDGRPADTDHAVIQLSSGSTGPSKVIGRTAENLVAEVHRYTLIDGVPRRGERFVLMASMVHVLGLVGGLLYGLHAGVRLDVPDRVSPDSILKTVGASEAPTTLLGVPFHIELLASVAEPPKLPQLTGMTTGGELVRGEVYDAFVDRYGIRLGNMYGMTEVGVIATDLFAEHRPSVRPAPGIPVRTVDGELQIGMSASPYVGLVDPTRWSDGWLHTRDSGSVDPETGLVTIHGRLDSQVSVGGLKVDLTEVEHTLAGVPGVTGAVVTFDRAIEAYVSLADPDSVDQLHEFLAGRLAAYKRPRVLHVLPAMPRTATGKLVRDRSVLASAAAEANQPDPTSKTPAS